MTKEVIEACRAITLTGQGIYVSSINADMLRHLVTKSPTTTICVYYHPGDESGIIPASDIDSDTIEEA